MSGASNRATNRVEQAVLTFDGLSCSQSVFSTYAPDFGIDRESALKIAGLFGGGVSHAGDTCGVVSGALMVLGLVHASTTPHDSEAKAKGYVVGQDFMQRFKARHGSIMCRDLLGANLAEPGEEDRARAEGLFQERCPEFVRSAAEILEEMLKGK